MALVRESIDLLKGKSHDEMWEEVGRLIGKSQVNETKKFFTVLEKDGVKVNMKFIDLEYVAKYIKDIKEAYTILKEKTEGVKTFDGDFYCKVRQVFRVNVGMVRVLNEKGANELISILTKTAVDQNPKNYYSEEDHTTFTHREALQLKNGYEEYNKYAYNS